MTEQPESAHLLDVLDDVLADTSVLRGSQPFVEERTEAVVDHLRDDPQAQLTLLLLAWEVKSDAAADVAAARHELRLFVEKVVDVFGIDLLATATANSDRLPSVFPRRLLLDATDEG